MIAVSVRPRSAPDTRVEVQLTTDGVARRVDTDKVVGGVWKRYGFWRFWRQGWPNSRRRRPDFQTRRDALLALALDAIN